MCQKSGIANVNHTDKNKYLKAIRKFNNSGESLEENETYLSLVFSITDKTNSDEEISGIDFSIVHNFRF